MEIRLKGILDTIIEWLKFAEAKNAALIAINSGIIYAIINILQDTKNISWEIQYYFIVSIAILLLAVLISLVSYIPQLTLSRINPKKISTKDDNLLFYGDISNYDAKSYLKAIYLQAGEDSKKSTKLEEDIAAQIIVNSRIALNKYNSFTYSIWLTTSVIITPVITAIIAFIIWKKEMK